jgi:hypothetical protein
MHVLSGRFVIPGLLAGLAIGAVVPVFATHGGGTEKVSVCHKGHTITIGAPAVPAHLAHGDTEGACEGGETPTETALATLTETTEATGTPTETPPDGVTETPTETPPDGVTETPTETPGEGVTETPTETSEVATDTPTDPPTDTATPTETPASGPSTTSETGTTVCHNGQTISVGVAAVVAHLRHGDTLGAC